MGCDIHLFVEYEDDLGYWKSVSQGPLDVERSYTLYGWLAGVRTEPPAHYIPPRGLPAGLSFDANDHFRDWAPDLHTASWMTEEEFFALIDAYPFPKNYALIVAIIRAAKEVSHGGVRIVFGFDN